MLALRTTCPLLKKDRVIEKVNKAANLHRNYQKSLFHHLKTYNTAGSKSTAAVSNSVKRRQSSQQNKRPKTRCTSITSSIRKGKNVNKTIGSTSMRESSSALDENVRANPFASGEALENYELKKAKKK